MYLLVQFAIYIHTHTQSLVGGEIFCCLFNQSYISNCRTLIRYLSQYQTDWDGISHAFMHSLTGREDRFRAYISAALTIALGFWKFVLRRAQNQCHALTGKQGFGSQKTICVSLKERKKKSGLPWNAIPLSASLEITLQHALLLSFFPLLCNCLFVHYDHRIATRGVGSIQSDVRILEVVEEIITLEKYDISRRIDCNQTLNHLFASVEGENRLQNYASVRENCET